MWLLDKPHKIATFFVCWGKLDQFHLVPSNTLVEVGICTHRKLGLYLRKLVFFWKTNKKYRNRFIGFRLVHIVTELTNLPCWDNDLCKICCLSPLWAFLSMFGALFLRFRKLFIASWPCKSVGFLSGTFLERGMHGKSLTKSTVFW